MFSSKSFIVSGLTFRSFLHFEFIFVYGVRKCLFHLQNTPQMYVFLSLPAVITGTPSHHLD